MSALDDVFKGLKEAHEFGREVAEPKTEVFKRRQLKIVLTDYVRCFGCETPDGELVKATETVISGVTGEAVESDYIYCRDCFNEVKKGFTQVFYKKKEY